MARNKDKEEKAADRIGLGEGQALGTPFQSLPELGEDLSENFSYNKEHLTWLEVLITKEGSHRVAVFLYFYLAGTAPGERLTEVTKVPEEPLLISNHGHYFKTT